MSEDVMESKGEETAVSSAERERETAEAKGAGFTEASTSKRTANRRDSAAEKSTEIAHAFSSTRSCLANGDDSASGAAKHLSAALAGDTAAAAGGNRVAASGDGVAAAAGGNGMAAAAAAVKFGSARSVDAAAGGRGGSSSSVSSRGSMAVEGGGRGTCSRSAAAGDAETDGGRAARETRQQEEEETDARVSEQNEVEEDALAATEEEEGDAVVAAAAASREEEDAIAAAAAANEEEATAAKEEETVRLRTGAAATGIQTNFDLEKKLEELLRKTDTYSAKIHGGGAALPSAAAAAGSSRSRRGLSEKEEDDILLRRLEEEERRGEGDGGKEEEEETGGGTAGQRIGEQPACIEGKMKHYQIEGLNWLYQLHCLDINGILADEMGLGKTLQTISILAFLQFEKNIAGPHLVICPRSTLDNWFNEVSKWCPRFRSARLHGTKEEREVLYNTVLAKGQFDVCITTYEMVIKDCHRLASNRFKWNYLIMDEAHRIKNEKSVLSEVVRRFRSRRRLLITGTPLQNNLRELWALLNFIMPHLFDSTLNFESLFDFSRINTEQQQQQVITTLHRILRPFMLRRLKADVARDLPPKREIYVFVGMSRLQKKLYADILSKNVEVLNAMSGNKTQMLNILMQLRKCCNHPYLFDGVEPGPPFLEGEHMVEAAGKMALLDKLLPRLRAEGSRVLLFSQMTRVLDILDDYCRWRGYEYCRIDGSTPGTERQERIDDFNGEGSKKFLFLLSTRAGGLGINLATADIVILFDSDFNPQMDLQAMDRAHRIGQKKKVVVYRFVTEATVEERIVERAAKKLKLDSLVIQKGRLGSGGAATSQRGPSTNELHDILQFGAQEVYRTQGESSITEADLDVILADAEQRTAEIQAQLTSLESKFDLSNISLDGGLHMYGADDDEAGSQTGKPGRKKMKFSRPATFFELGDRKTKWRGEGSCSLAKKERKFTRRTLSGWRAEINGGYDFQFFNAEQLDYLDNVQRRWQAYLEERKRKRLEELKSEQRAAAAAESSESQQPAAKKVKVEEETLPCEEEEEERRGEEGEERRGEEGKERGGEGKERGGEGKEEFWKREAMRRRETEEEEESRCSWRKRQQQQQQTAEVQQLLCGLLSTEEKIPNHSVSLQKEEASNINKEEALVHAPLCPSLHALTYNQLHRIKNLLSRYCSRVGLALNIEERAAAGGQNDDSETPAEDDVSVEGCRRLAKELRCLLTPVSTGGEIAVEEEETPARTCLFPHPAATSFEDALLRLATQLVNGEAAAAGVEMALRVAQKRERQQHEAAAGERQQQGEQHETAAGRGGGEEEEQGVGVQQQVDGEVEERSHATAAAAGSNSSSPCGGVKKKAGRPRKAPVKEEGSAAAAAADEDGEDSAALLQLLQQEDLDDKNDPDRPQEFTEDMSREKERLLAEGFGHWNRTEFTKFVSALIHYGKERLEEAWVAYFRGTNKTLDDVQEYAEVFFKRYLEVEGGDRIMQRVEKAADIRGALDSQRRAVQSVVEEQLRSSVIARPQDLQLPARLPQSAVFTRDEDRMLLWGLYEQGINAYALVHAALKYYWFDTRGFFRIASRTVKQVEERCKEIVAAVEAELSEKTGCKEHMRMRHFRHSSHRIGRPPTRTGVAGSAGGYRSSAAAAGGGSSSAAGGRGTGSQPEPHAAATLLDEDCSSSSKGNSSKNNSGCCCEGNSGGSRGGGGGAASSFRDEDVDGDNQTGSSTQKTRSENPASASSHDSTTTGKEAVTTATREDEGHTSSRRGDIESSRPRKGGTETGQESVRGGSGGGGGGGSEQQRYNRGGSSGGGGGGRRRGRPRGGSVVAGTSCRGAAATAGSPAASEITGGGKRSTSEKLCVEGDVVEDVCPAESSGGVGLEPIRKHQPHTTTENESTRVTGDTRSSVTSGREAGKTEGGDGEMTDEQDNSAIEGNFEVDKQAGKIATGHLAEDGISMRAEVIKERDARSKSVAEETGDLLPALACSGRDVSQEGVGDANQERPAVARDSVDICRRDPTMTIQSST